MTRRLPQLLVLLGATVGFSTIVSADTYDVGILSYDQISASDNQFDISNGTGSNASAFGFPITTQLSINVSSLVVNFTTGPALNLPGSDFAVVDAQGDVDCTAAACNLFGDNIVSAVLTGTFSPTTGISGLTPPDTGIVASFTDTLTPSAGSTLEAGIDANLITATGSTGSTGSVPEPGAFTLLGSIMVGAALIGIKTGRLRRNAA